ncbi:MAG: flavodoxin family protein [Bacilli bacterium]
MRTIIHDLENNDFLELNKDDVAICNKSNGNCMGCFNCWVRTPFECTIKDSIKNNGKTILDSDELIIISKCINGSYSYKVKAILERSISYVEPFFTIRNNEIHHKARTDKKLNFKVFFYGDDISDIDKKTVTKLVLANQKNLNTKDPEIYFINNIKEIKI